MRTGTVNVSILRGGVMEHPGDIICEDGEGATTNLPYTPRLAEYIIVSPAPVQLA